LRNGGRRRDDDEDDDNDNDNDNDDALFVSSLVISSRPQPRKQRHDWSFGFTSRNALLNLTLYSIACASKLKKKILSQKNACVLAAYI